MGKGLIPVTWAGLFILAVLVVMGGWPRPMAGEGAALPPAESSVEEAVLRLVKEQEAAVRRGDKGAYLKTLSQADPFFLQEEKHWFDDAVGYLAHRPFSREYLSLKADGVGTGEVVAELRQSYQDAMGRRKEITYLEVFVQEDGIWKDAGKPFYALQVEGIQVLYASPTDRVRAGYVAETAKETVDRFRALYGWVPQRPVQIKLYSEPEVFRQSVKLSLPGWAVGWYEYGEAVKFLSLPQMKREHLGAGIVHELSHKMVGEMTSDNAAYWLQEGIAESHQREWLQERGAIRPEATAYGGAKLWSLPQMMEINLEELTPREAEQYYRQARLLVEYVRKTYGDEIIRHWMETLRRYPYHPQTTAEKLKLTNARTTSALEEITGKSLQQLSREWEQYLSK